MRFEMSCPAGAALFHGSGSARGPLGGFHPPGGARAGASPGTAHPVDAGALGTRASRPHRDEAPRGPCSAPSRQGVPPAQGRSSGAPIGHDAALGRPARSGPQVRRRGGRVKMRAGRPRSQDAVPRRSFHGGFVETLKAAPNRPDTARRDRPRGVRGALHTCSHLHESKFTNNEPDPGRTPRRFGPRLGLESRLRAPSRPDRRGLPRRGTPSGKGGRPRGSMEA